MALKRNPDPVLEKLRSEVDGPPNLDTLALNSQRLTANVHAAYLFEMEGLPTLRQLCLLLSATASGKLYSGWQEFAARLGLSFEQIQCIDYDFKGLQDPTYYVLLAYVQSAEATLDKIIMALQKIGRLDIINRIYECMSKFIDSLDLKEDANDIHRPHFVPRAPLVLSPVIVMKEDLQTRCCDDSSVSRDSVKSVHHEKLKKAERHYASTVMLTYTDDGAATAKNIAKIFRAKEPKIGVLMLHEQEKYVYSRAEEFVEDCFKQVLMHGVLRQLRLQVNYIIPILTRGYVEQIKRGFCNNATMINTSLDSKYLKYIYSLLRFEYAKNNCCNNRVRCIVPEKDVLIVIRSDLHPTLQAWFRETDIDAFTENILLRKI